MVSLPQPFTFVVLSHNQRGCHKGTMRSVTSTLTAIPEREDKMFTSVSAGALLSLLV